MRQSVIFVVISILLVALGACTGMDPQNFTVLNPVIANRQTPVETATVFREPTVTLTVTPSQTPTLTPTSTPTPVPSSTQTSSPTPTATWINQKAGEVTAPILLYHHIASTENPSLYYISPETFKSQMEALKSWGYTSITIMQLIKVMLTGGELPVRPIVISFDDGDEDVYENAFPIMQQLGLTGTFFPIVEAIDQKGTVTHDQLKKMADSGWEIGSHSMTHPDLRDPKFGIRWEIYDSKAELEKIIGRPVEVFAYPFGIADTYIMTKTSKYGYKAAVGLGLSYRHDRNTLFYLNRIAIEYKVNLEDFGKLLPWSDMPAQ